MLKFILEKFRGPKILQNIKRKRSEINKKTEKLNTKHFILPTNYRTYREFGAIFKMVAADPLPATSHVYPMFFALSYG